MGCILIATDGEPWTRDAVRHFLQTSCIGAADIHVLTVIAPAEGSEAGDRLVAARKILNDATLELSLAGRSVQGMIRMGNAVDVITQVVKELDADLLVLGTRGLASLAIGVSGGRSVAEALLHNVSCGVLIYPMRVEHTQGLAHDVAATSS